MNLKNKKAAMEMSMGTIVTIVLLVSVLILGLVFVRNIMCSGIAISDDITDSVKGEVTGLFGRQEYGVKCVGEEKIQKIGADGNAKTLGCVVISDENVKYDFKVTEIKRLDGNPSQEQIESWIIEDEVQEVSIAPGENIVNFITIKPPQKIDSTTIRLKIDATKEGLGTETHYMKLDISSVGILTTTVC